MQHVWHVARRTPAVSVFEPGAGSAASPPSTQPQRKPTFCQGWYGNTGSGWPMSETHAPFWIYGRGRVKLLFAQSPLARRITVDGRSQKGPTLRLGTLGWHVVTVDVPHLVQRSDGKKVGLTLLGLRPAG